MMRGFAWMRAWLFGTAAPPRTIRVEPRLVVRQSSGGEQ